MTSPFENFSTITIEKGKKKSNRGFLISLVIFTLMLGYLFFQFRPQATLTESAIEVGSEVVEIEIRPGASITEIANTLKDQRVLATVAEFVAAAEANPESSQIGPGRYLIQQGIPASNVVLALLNPESRIGIRLVIPEGSRSSQVARSLASIYELEVEEVLNVMKDRDLVPLPDWLGDNIEGALYPATYRFDEGTSLEEVLNAVVARFETAVEDSNLFDRAEAAGLAPYEVLIMASIIEKEVAPSDFARAARVLLNRLEMGMPLQLDSTLNYALDSNTIIFTTEELAQENEYNTYLISGLPPSPISNPSEFSIAAVLNPEEGEWIYWVTVNLDTKETKFAVSNDEFLVYKREFQEWYRQSQAQ